MARLTLTFTKTETATSGVLTVMVPGGARPLDATTLQNMGLDATVANRLARDFVIPYGTRMRIRRVTLQAGDQATVTLVLYANVFDASDPGAPVMTLDLSSRGTLSLDCDVDLGISPGTFALEVRYTTATDVAPVNVTVEVEML